MTLVLKKNRTTLPSAVSEFFNSENLFPRVFDINGDLFDFKGSTRMLPHVNIIENGKDFKIDLAAPGLERKDFKVEVDNGVLTVSAEKEEEKKEEHEN